MDNNSIIQIGLALLVGFLFYKVSILLQFKARTEKRLKDLENR